MKTYYDADADLSLLRGRRIAVIGYGSQGHAHALNLRDSGMDVCIGLPPEARRRQAALAAGFEVQSPAEAAARADIVMLLAPDEAQPALYSTTEPHLRKGAALGFATGFAVHFALVRPRPDLDVFLVAPKNVGPVVREAYIKGGGVAALVAVHQNAGGGALPLALAYGSAIGAGRAGMMETTFEAECVVDLFGEQAVLCGGLPALLRAAFETLVEAGYAPEMAYFKCVHQVKLVADLIAQGGLAHMMRSVSNTAAYGGYRAGERLIGPAVKQTMQAVLEDIRSGAFAREWMAERQAGLPAFAAARQKEAEAAVEQAGARVRSELGSGRPSAENTLVAKAESPYPYSDEAEEKTHDR